MAESEFSAVSHKLRSHEVAPAYQIVQGSEQSGQLGGGRRITDVDQSARQHLVPAAKCVEVTRRSDLREPDLGVVRQTPLEARLDFVDRRVTRLRERGREVVQLGADRIALRLDSVPIRRDPRANYFELGQEGNETTAGYSVVLGSFL